MHPAEIIGYVAAVLVGLVIGLAGGGGSILTVPIFVYLFGIPPLQATTYSLFVVGATSLVGSVHHLVQGRVNASIAGAFAIPSFISVYLTRRYLVPALPDPLFRFGTFVLPKEDAILFFFVIVMLLAARAMIKRQKPRQGMAADRKPRYVPLALDGLAVGVLTGTIGAGGGFLIVPLLVLLAGLPIHRAVATSVFLIAVNSTIGLLGDWGHIRPNWALLGPFTALSIVGIFIGMGLSGHVPPAQLKRGFGWFVLAVAAFMIVREIIGR